MVEVEEDEAKRGVEMLDPLDAVVLQTDEPKIGFVGQDGHSMQSLAIQVDSIWVLESLVLRPLHFDGPAHSPHASNKHPVDLDSGRRGALPGQGVAAVGPPDGLHRAAVAEVRQRIGTFRCHFQLFFVYRSNINGHDTQKVRST
jgi:hypothetical protein